MNTSIYVLQGTIPCRLTNTYQRFGRAF